MIENDKPRRDFYERRCERKIVIKISLQVHHHSTFGDFLDVVSLSSEFTFIVCTFSSCHLKRKQNERD